MHKDNRASITLLCNKLISINTWPAPKVTKNYVSHFLCHCITDFFLPIDIQLIWLVIYARFLYHYGITTLSLATWMGNRYTAYTYLYISILQIKQTINTWFPSLQTTRLFCVKTAIKLVKPGGFYCPARHFSCRTPPCYPLLHPDVPAPYTRM